MYFNITIKYFIFLAHTKFRYLYNEYLKLSALEQAFMNDKYNFLYNHKFVLDFMTKNKNSYLIYYDHTIRSTVNNSNYITRFK